MAEANTYCAHCGSLRDYCESPTYGPTPCCDKCTHATRPSAPAPTCPHQVECNHACCLAHGTHCCEKAGRDPDAPSAPAPTLEGNSTLYGAAYRAAEDIVAHGSVLAAGDRSCVQWMAQTICEWVRRWQSQSAAAPAPITEEGRACGRCPHPWRYHKPERLFINGNASTYYRCNLCKCSGNEAALAPVSFDASATLDSTGKPPFTREQQLILDLFSQACGGHGADDAIYSHDFIGAYEEAQVYLLEIGAILAEECMYD